jgi:uracil-DNA glycosylase family 4
MNKKNLDILYKSNANPSKENILYIENAKQFVCGSGNPNAEIIFIGEAPGAEEEILGIPFCGRSGKLLRFYLNKYSFDTKNSFITNVVKFRPPNNRKPTNEEINIHGKLLKSELEIIQPKIIVPVGAVAAQFILEKNISISKIRGQIIKKEAYLIFPIFHPAYILRNQNLLSLFENDIHALQKITMNIKIII